MRLLSPLAGKWDAGRSACRKATLAEMAQAMGGSSERVQKLVESTIHDIDNDSQRELLDSAFERYAETMWEPLRIDDAPENVAKALSGIKSDKSSKFTFKRERD